MTLKITCFLVVLVVVGAMPNHEERKAKAMALLYHLRYTDNSTATAYEAKDAICGFQQRFRLQVTGELDEETLCQLEVPRCGAPDKPHAVRVKRAVFEYVWDKTALTYKISDFGNSADSGTISTEDRVASIIQDAFQHWSDVTDLTFQRLGPNEDVDLEIKFVIRNHGDGSQNSFDGSGGVLAHAFFPQSETPTSPSIDGDSHFDDEENWTDGTTSGINLLWVAVHEFGHALGLDHSDDRTAIMYPFYTGYDPNLSLKDDDIKSIQDGYGKPTEASTSTSTASPTTVSTSTASPTTESSSTASPTTVSSSTAAPTTVSSSTASPTTVSSSTASPTTVSSSTTSPTTVSSSTTSSTMTTPAAPSPPTYCGENAFVDAITTFSDNYTYIFRGDSFWKRSPEEDITGPMVTMDHWTGLEDGRIDAALTFEFEGVIATYLIQGTSATKYRYVNSMKTSKHIDSFPKSTKQRGRGRQVIPSLPVTAAFVQKGAVVLLNTGPQTFKLNKKRLTAIGGRTSTVESYTRGEFQIGADIDAAWTKPNGKVFLFSGQDYYVISKKKIARRKGKIGEDFLGCPPPSDD